MVNKLSHPWRDSGREMIRRAEARAKTDRDLVEAPDERELLQQMPVIAGMVHRGADE